MFGSEPKAGLSSLSLSHEIIERLETEEDLVTIQTSQPEATPQHCPVSSTEMPTATASTAIDNAKVHPSSEHENTLQLVLASSLPIQVYSEPPPLLSPAFHTLIESCQNNTSTQCKRAREAQLCMVKRSRVELKAGEIEGNVAVPIPTVDRGRGEP